MEDVSNSKVVIRHTSDEKYIVARVVDLEKEGDSGFLCLVSEALCYHSDIYNKFSQELRLEGKYRVSRVLGGGLLVYSPEDKFIRTYGQSGGYGKAPKELVEAILRNTYPDWRMDVTVTSYIRD